MDKTNGNNKTISAKKIALMAMFIALISVGAMLSIPVPPVPFTLQTLFVLAAGALLGGVEGFICVVIYIMMGLFGLPVFANFGGGFAYALKPSFGFTIGFAFGALFTGLIINKSQKPSYLRIISAVLVGTVTIYLFGISYYIVLKLVYLGGAIDMWNVFLTFWIMFIPTDIVKGAVVVFVTKKVRPLVK